MANLLKIGATPKVRAGLVLTLETRATQTVGFQKNRHQVFPGFPLLHQGAYEKYSSSPWHMV
ncbi:MAG: hypothetical protein DMF20_09310 [Verrucomicrobia bacterium]|nr:MAG: hypothetical protein DMF20_09310 [Verrucomicrobiota bacterium]